MDAYMSGIHPGVLGSARDEVIRRYLSIQKSLESYKLTAQIAAHVGKTPKTSVDVLKKYNDLLWGVEAVMRDKYAEMQSYYAKYVQNITPEAKLITDKSGEKVLKVTGLEGLM